MNNINQEDISAKNILDFFFVFAVAILLFYSGYQTIEYQISILNMSLRTLVVIGSLFLYFKRTSS